MCAIKDPETIPPKHYLNAFKRLGLKEFTGKLNNPLVVDLYRLAVGKEYPDSVAWCAAFVGACLVEAGLPSSNSLLAKSYLSYGKSIETPIVGDIVVLWRGSKNAITGHVGFFVKEDSLFVWLLGGNQNDQVSISRYPKSRVLDYRRV